MSSSLPYVAAGFHLQRVVAIAPAVLRARFTHDPKLANPADANDGLNPNNYQLSGAHVALVTGVNPVVGDPQSVEIYVNAPLSPGVWTLLASTAIQQVDLTALSSPNAMTFPVAVTATLSPINGGAENDDAERIIRKHLPPSFTGEGWDSLIKALSVADDNNWENARLAFDQLFLSTASGLYLDRQAGDEGIPRPRNLGMPDALFRRYAAKNSANKLTLEAILEILEIFYGTDAVRAHIESDFSEPFDIEDQQTLKVLIDNKDLLEVVFNDDEFTQIGEATALEVAAAITTQLQAAQIQAFATSFFDPETGTNKVRIYSQTMGIGSSVSIVGGLAQIGLGFPENLNIAIPIGASFSISIPETGVVRYSLTGSIVPIFSDIETGDYVNIVAQNFAAANRGSFELTDVYVKWNGATYDQWFEVRNDSGLIQSGPLLTISLLDLQFYRPKEGTIQDIGIRSVIASQSQPGEIDVLIPATTQAVGRGPDSAAYLKSQQPLDISSFTWTADGLAKITTATPHGIVSSGQQVLVDGVWPAPAVPSTLAGVPSISGNIGTTSVSQTSLSSSIRTVDALSARFDHSVTTLADGNVMVVGGEDGASYFGTASRFTILSSAVISSGVAKGRLQYSYNYLTTASRPTVSSLHTATALQGALRNQLLVTGGKTTAGVATSASHLYRPATNDWVAVSGLTARWGHQAARVQDVGGDDVVYLVGGQTSAVAASNVTEKFTSAGTIVAHSTETTGRFAHRAVAATSSKFIVIGGAQFPGPTVRSDCWGYDHQGAAAFNVGNLAIARRDFAAVKIRDGAVMVIGGYGHNLINETSDRVLGECEIWEQGQSSWRPAGTLRYPRRYPQAQLIGDNLYVMGGIDGSNAPVTKIEIYSVSRGKWITGVSSLDADFHIGGASDVTSGLVFAYGGKNFAGTANADTRLLVPGSQSLSSTGVNRQIPVASIVDSTNILVELPANQYMNSSDGSLTLVKAQAVPTNQGPFVYNPDGDPAVTAVETSITQDLAAGRQYTTLSVASTADFPDADGYLAIDYGFPGAVYPVKYLGKISATELQLDFSFVFPVDISSGAKVTLLSQKNSFVPENPESVDTFYLTASSSGRLAAEEALRASLAAGINANITVRYPGDRGLGNEGQPTTGQKVNDQVVIWGSDNPDEDLKKARG